LVLRRLDGSGLTPKIFVGDVNIAIVIRMMDLSDSAFDPLTEGCPPPLDLSTATPGVDTLIRISKPGDAEGDPLIFTGAQAALFADTTLDGLPDKDNVGGTSDGSDGYIVFRTPVGFLDRPGRWLAQGVATIGATVVSSEIVEFEVFSILS
jgi:hypothetical protein